MDVDAIDEDVNPYDITEGLPREICFRILSLLNAKDLATASRVSKSVRTACVMDNRGSW